jgi:hypothetical protein
VPGEVSLGNHAGVWHKRLDSADSDWGGPGSAIPHEVNASDSSAITVAADSCVLFTRERD